MDGAITMNDVLLCSMPFGSIQAPSLGLSLLKATLAETPYSATVRYYSLLFAEQISYGAYQRVTYWQANPYQQLGEWLFAAAVFTSSPQDTQAYVERCLRSPSSESRPFFQPKPEWFNELALAVRRQVEPFLDRCLQEVSQITPRLVGFSCMFQQRLASLALAQRIKARWPQTFVVFGGPLCEGLPGVELLRQFPYVDAVVSGRGEAVFPEIVRRVMDGRAVTGLTGVYTQAQRPPAAGTSPFPNAPTLAGLDEIPYPDFDDYFDQLKTSGVSLPCLPALSLETSRGCWWGQKSQCTFCGQNGFDLAYSAKSPGRALAELEYFARKYPGLDIYATDNVLCEAYFDEVLPALARRRLGARLFYEVRATLSKAQIHLLRESGVEILQPGIESLNTDLLRRMHKGTTLFDNLQCLKWAREFGLSVSWNFLYGFPGEPPATYAGMAELVPLLTHLPPPAFMIAVLVERFSPLFNQAGKFGLKNIRPSPAFAYIFPFKEKVLANLATTFIYDLETPQPVESYTQGLNSALEMWQQAYPLSTLEMVDEGGRLCIHDERPVAVQEMTIFTGLQRDLYLACDEAQSVSQLQRRVTTHTGQAATPEEIEHWLQPMLANKLMLQEGQRFLSLAIPAADCKV